MATYLDPEHRQWLNNDELKEVEDDLVKQFPLPRRVTQRNLQISQAVHDEPQENNMDVEEINHKNHLTPNNFAKMMSTNLSLKNF